MIAFVCSSPVQIMRAIHMKMTYNICEDDADIFVLHKCPGYERLAVNIKKTGLFKHVYATDVSVLGKRIVCKLIFGKNKYSKLIRKERYNKLFTFNIEDELAQGIFCINKDNPGFQHHCVEDGPNIYQIYEPPKYMWYHPFRWFGFDRQAYHIENWWSSCPEFIEVPKSFHTTKQRLIPINYNNAEYIKVVNMLFDYEPDKLLEDADLLIMDESHYADGLIQDNSDINLYKKIKYKYPELNILVKLHPRTVDNRYDLVNFRVMKKSDIPWELYVLNREHNRKKDIVQIGIVCGTMVSDHFMFGIEGKKIILAPLFYDKVLIPSNGIPRVSEKETKNYEKLRSEYIIPNNLMIAYTEKDVYDALDYFFNNQNDEV